MIACGGLPCHPLAQMILIMKTTQDQVSCHTEGTIRSKCGQNEANVFNEMSRDKMPLNWLHFPLIISYSLCTLGAMVVVVTSGVETLPGLFAGVLPHLLANIQSWPQCGTLQNPSSFLQPSYCNSQLWQPHLIMITLNRGDIIKGLSSHS